MAINRLNVANVRSLRCSARHLVRLYTRKFYHFSLTHPDRLSKSTNLLIKCF